MKSLIIWTGECMINYEAQKCNRVPVTAKWLFEHPDIYGYVYREESIEYGLDPWIVVGGVDSLRDGSKIILEYGSTGEMLVDPDFVVYVSSKDI